MTRNEEPMPQLARLEEYLRQDPGNDGLQAEVFDAALAGGKRELARRLADEALARVPAHPGWRHRCALLMLAEKDYAEAERELERLVSEAPEVAVVRHNLAYALFAQRKYEASSLTVRPLLDSPGPDGATAWALWLRSQHRLYRLKEALEAFRSVLARIAISPEVLGVASLIAAEAGSLAEARAWSERALSGRPDQMEALAARGTVALAAEDAPKALAFFSRALRVNQHDGRIWSGVGLAHMLQMDLTGADQAFAQAVETMPDHVGTWLAWGFCRLVSNHPQEAREAFEKALELDRNFADSHGALACALIRLGEADRGRDEMELALRLNRGSVSARLAQTLLSGEVADPAAMLRLGRRVLEQQRALLSPR